LLDKKVIEKIYFEISLIEHLLKTHEILLQTCKQKEPDSTELAAIGTILHSFYNGVEKIFLFIAKIHNISIPVGEKWHRELVKKIAILTNSGKKFISDEILETILDYLGFRHYFRHSYDFQLNWDFLKDKTINLENNWNIIKKAIENFLH